MPRTTGCPTGTDVVWALRPQQSVAPAQHALTCENTNPRNKPRPRLGVRNTLRNTLTCGNTACATIRLDGAPIRAETRALGPCTGRGGLFEGAANAVALRALREGTRTAPPVLGRPEGTRPDQAPDGVHLPVMRREHAQPADAPLRQKVGLQAPESRSEAARPGRGPEAETARGGRPETGAAQRAEARAGGAPQAAARRHGGRPEAVGARPLPQREQARAGRLPRRELHKQTLRLVSRREDGRPGDRPGRGLRRRVHRRVRRVPVATFRGLPWAT
jgi:hypothetical protein